VTLDVSGEWNQPLGPLVVGMMRGENVIEFVSHDPATKLPDDSRSLAIGVMNLSLTTDAGAKPLPCELQAS